MRFLLQSPNGGHSGEAIDAGYFKCVRFVTVSDVKSIPAIVNFMLVNPHSQVGRPGFAESCTARNVRYLKVQWEGAMPNTLPGKREQPPAPENRDRVQLKARNIRSVG